MDAVTTPCFLTSHDLLRIETLIEEKAATPLSPAVAAGLKELSDHLNAQIAAPGLPAPGANASKPFTHRIRRCEGNRNAWTLVMLRADGTECLAYGSYTTAPTIDALLAHARHLTPGPDDRVELVYSPAPADAARPRKVCGFDALRVGAVGGREF